MNARTKSGARSAALWSSIALTAALGLSPTGAQAQDQLDGDARTACEVILCLSTGSRPDQCSPPLRKFFSIKKPWKRVNFLRLCPKKNSNDWNEEQLVYDNLQNDEQITEVQQGVENDGGRLIATVEDISVLNCRRVGALPEYQGQLPDPVSVPDGRVRQTPEGVFQSWNGYANKELTYAGVEIGYGAGFQRRLRKVDVKSGNNIAVGDWGQVEVVAFNQCQITDIGDWMWWNDR